MQAKSLLFTLLSFACIAEASALSKHAKNNFQNMNHSNKLYFSVETGVSMPSISSYESEELYSDKSFKTNIPVSGEFGYKFSNSLRVGFNISYRGHNFDDTVVRHMKNEQDVEYDAKYHITHKVRNTAMLLNGKYSLNMAGFQPYVGIGLGFTYAAIGDYLSEERDEEKDTSVIYKTFGQDKMQFAWNFGLGIEKQFGDWSIGLGYRYMDFGKMKLSNLRDVITVVKNVSELTDVTRVPDKSFAMKAHEISLGVTYSFRG